MKNVLIRGVNWLGDAVMSLPAVRAIRKLHPEAKISILVKDRVSELFKLEKSVDEVLIYRGGLKGKIETIRMLREGNFSRAYLLQNALDAALIATLAGIPERVGWSRDCRGFLLTHPVPYNREDRKMHHIDYFFQIPKRFNPALTPEYPWIYLPLLRRVEARRELRKLRRPILAIAPGARYGETKRWRTERFREIALRFIEKYGDVVLLGLRGDGFKVEPEELKGEGEIWDFTGKTSLTELISLLSESDLLLCNDSGIMHLGYGLGVPLVALFGSTSPELTGPPRFAGKVIKAQVDCSPCFRSSCKEVKCIDSIEVDEVWSAIEEIVPRRRAVFFDRDGTLCRDAHYLSRWEDFEPMPDLEVLRELKERGFLLIGVTNQSGIARGIVKEEFVKEVNQLFIEKYGFDDFLYCPHHPDDRCFCRKPNPQMALIARYKYRINFKSSYVVGDKESDMEFAEMIGARGIMIGRDASKLTEVVEIIKRETDA